MNFLKNLLTLVPRISPDILSRTTVIQGTGWLLIASFLAGAQFWIIQFAMSSRTSNMVAQAQGILDGFPHWRIYQSRVLGPYLMEWLQHFTGWEFERCYNVVVYLCLAMFFLAILLIARSIWDSAIGAIGTAAGAGFLNALLMQSMFLYPWDYINITISVILVWAIIKGKSLWFICIPLVVGIFNHELALIILGWLALDSVFRFKREDKWMPSISIGLRWRQLLVTSALLIAGYFIIEGLRNTLLIHSAKVDSDISRVSHLAVLMLPDNLDALRMSFSINPETHQQLTNTFGNSLLIIFNPIIFGILATTIWGIFSRNINISRISLLYLILWVSTVVFGLIYETRVWLLFVPYVVLVLPVIISDYKGYFHPLSKETLNLNRGRLLNSKNTFLDNTRL